MRDRLLIQHFLRRLLDQDLISPHADRHEVIAVAVATLITSGVFVTILLGTQYVFMPFQSPGRTAAVAVNDRVLYSGWSMVIMALVAVAQWEALTIDARDASILGPLPLSHWAIVRAKVAAVGLFALGVAAALNGAPSLLHPILMVAKLSVDLDVVIALIVSHAFVTMMAGAFGFLAVLGLREVVRAILGPAGFERISVLIQAGLVLGLVTLFLLLPSLSADGTGRSNQTTLIAAPVYWFAGLHERLAGHVIDQFPRSVLPGPALRLETNAMVLYREQQPILRELGRIAVTRFGFLVLMVLVAYLWNSRQFPGPTPVRPARRRWGLGAACKWAAQSVLARQPVPRAGFFFTLQVLARSVPHRLTLAASLAVGLAFATGALDGVDLRHTVGLASVPLGLFATQNVLLVALLAGLWQVIRVPVELRANWTFQLAFAGDERPYLSGVKRAVLLGVATPVLLGLFPLHAVVMGMAIACAHGASGVLLVLLLVEGTMLGFRKLPFASAYVPTGQLKAVGLPLLLIALVAAYGLAWIERLAISTGNTLAFLAVLAALPVGLHGLDRWQRRERRAIDLDEGPAPATQRFELSE